MRTVQRLSGQRRTFQLTKAADKELEKELQELAEAKYRKEISESKKEMYGR